MNAPQGRGRGRGLLWPPHMPLARGGRPGMRGFPPVMMGADGFTMPDIFGAGPRGFPPYNPRFSAGFTGPPPGMMFHGRPQFPGGGFGMMMGPGRPPFMGGMGVASATPARGGRPGIPPMFPPQSSQNPNRTVKRDLRDRNDRGGHEMTGQPSSALDDEAQYQQGLRAQPEDQFGGGNSFRNEESESEDEAPRRSRHGEGKKR